MAEYASNAKGNAGLTTGIIGTSLAGLLALGAGNNPTSAMCVENMNSWLQNSEYTPIPKVTTSTTPSA